MEVASRSLPCVNLSLGVWVRPMNGMEFHSYAEVTFYESPPWQTREVLLLTRSCHVAGPEGGPKELSKEMGTSLPLSQEINSPNSLNELRRGPCAPDENTALLTPF